MQQELYFLNFKENNMLNKQYLEPKKAEWAKVMSWFAPIYRDINGPISKDSLEIAIDMGFKHLEYLVLPYKALDKNRNKMPPNTNLKDWCTDVCATLVYGIIVNPNISMAEKKELLDKARHEAEGLDIYLQNYGYSAKAIFAEISTHMYASKEHAYIEAKKDEWKKVMGFFAPNCSELETLSKTQLQTAIEMGFKHLAFLALGFNKDKMKQNTNYKDWVVEVIVPLLNAVKGSSLSDADKNLLNQHIYNEFDSLKEPLRQKGCDPDDIINDIMHNAPDMLGLNKHI